MKGMMRAVVQLFLLIACCNSIVAEQITVRIGATLPLTARLAIAGDDTRKGIELAVKEFSSTAVSLEAFFEDNQHDPKQAVSSAQKLLDQDKADILISMWDMADVVAPLTEKRQVPHLAIRWNPDITKQYSYTFTIESTFRSYIDSLLSLLKTTNVRTVSLLTEQGQGWILAADYLKAQSSKYGISVLTDERYLPGGPDYKSTVLRASKGKPDSLILLSNPPNTESLIKQIRENNPRQRYTGYFEIVDPNQVEGVPFVAQFEVADWFLKKFRDAFGEAPKSRAAQAYDIVHLISIATNQYHEKPTIESLKQAVRNKLLS